MSELSLDEPSIATAGTARTGELARGGTDLVAERRRAVDRERERRASAQAPPAESQPAPPTPELRSRRLGARNGNQQAARSSVKKLIPAKIAPKNLGGRRVAYHFIAKAALANARRRPGSFAPWAAGGA
jgi:hypothetical protein